MVGDFSFENAGFMNPYDEYRNNVAIANKPIEFLSMAKANNYSMNELVRQLFLVRGELNKHSKKNNSFNISADSDFIKFYKFGNHSQEFYEGLFSLLKRAGYQSEEVNQFISNQEESLIEKERNTFSKSTKGAMNVVYGKE